jgi:acyl transferase domain-containing protein
MVLSPDGKVRPFDAQARGTIFTNGCTVLVLKRLDQALKDRDNIYAVLRGLADNNDGSREKNFFAAPSAAGQSEVIASALRNANVRPRRVSYVEAHGTGTLVGDPIEFQGLCRVYAPDTPPLMKSPAIKQAAESKLHARQWCGLGSVKGHIGHPNTAAGACALAKVLLMLRHKQLVPIANYKTPNPAIDFANSPFYPCTDLRHWAAPADGGPRTAALSAFGMGGTNAHVVLEEFGPEYERSSNKHDRSSNKQWRENQKSQVNDSNHTQIKQRSSSSSSNLLVVTGRTPRSLRDNLRRLKAYFGLLVSSSNDTMRKEVLADVSMTLLLGRHHFRECRWHAVVRSCDDAALRISQALEEAEKQSQTLHEEEGQQINYIPNIAYLSIMYLT